MKHLTIIVFLLVTTVSVTAGTQDKKRPEPTATGQRSERLRNEIHQILNDLPKELSSQTQREQFASTVKLLVNRRIEANVQGYEQTPSFRRDFAQAYDRFQATLHSGSPTFKQDQIEEFANLSIRAFETNQEKFRSFYEKVIKPDPQFKDMSMLEVRKTLLQFSAWLFINDESSWRMFWRITFCWPWCYTGKNV